MPRPPLPIGTWGKIRTYPTHYSNKGKPDRFRAIAKYRDHDGRTRLIEGYGKSATAAQNHLRTKLKERAATSTKGELTSMHRFAVAAEMWFERLATSAAEAGAHRRLCASTGPRWTSMCSPRSPRCGSAR